MSLPSSATPDCSFFVTRIMFHSFLLILYPVFTVYAFSFSNIFVLSGLAIFIVIMTLLAGDWVTFHRRPPVMLWYFADITLSGSLIPLSRLAENHDWDTPDSGNFDPWQELLFYSNAFFFSIYWLPAIIVILYVLFLNISLIYNSMKHGHSSSPLFATGPPTSPDSDQQSTSFRWLLGPRRSDEEEHLVEHGCAKVIFGRTMFRKHPFEPVLLGLVRGTIAMWAMLGLLGYLVFLIYEQEFIASSISPVQQSLTMIDRRGFDESTEWPVYFGAYQPEILVRANRNVTSHKVATYRDLNITIPDAVDGNQCDTSHAKDSSDILHANCTFTATGDPFSSLYISLSSNVSVSIWVLDSLGNQRHDFPTARRYTRPFVLEPNQHLIGSLSVRKITLGRWEWLAYNPRVEPDTNSSAISQAGLNTSSIVLSTVLPSSLEWIASEEITSTSIAGAALQIISTVGGVYVVVNGIFFFIFGRSLLAVIIGGRPLSPFGLSSLFPSFKKAISDAYPDMQQDLKSKGMARFVHEVAMDVGVVGVVEDKDRA